MPVLSEMIRQAITRYGDSPAIVDADLDRTFTYSEFGIITAGISRVLQDLDLPTGSHIALCARNGILWASIEAAVSNLGMTLVPLSTYLSAEELRWILRDSQAALLVFDEDKKMAVEQMNSTAPRGLPPSLMISSHATDAETTWPVQLPQIDALLSAGERLVEEARPNPIVSSRIVYTSATTGKPKGVAIANDMTVAMIMSTLANQLHDLQESDRFIATTPLTHVSGLFFWPFFVTGHASVLFARYEPARFCGLVTRHRVTHAVMAPTLVADLVKHLEESTDDHGRLSASQLRALWYAGSPIPTSVSQRAQQILGKVLHQQYGLTEMLSGYPSSGATVLTPEAHATKPGSCGRPYPGVVLRMVDTDGVEVGPRIDGEIAILMQAGRGGYWSIPEGATSAYRDGWLYTGDTGYLDEEGYIYLRDRTSDMIVTGGLNVYPTEVESVLLEHPDVAACAVVGMNDPRWVEVPVAVIVRKPGSNPSSGDLVEHVRDRIAHFKAPKKIFFTEALPISANGKLLRREVRRELVERILVDNAPQTDLNQNEANTGGRS